MRITNEKLAEAIKLYKEGKTNREISEATGVNSGLVYTAIKTLRAMGMEIPERDRCGKRDWNNLVGLLK